jgi:tRNA 2-thiouridine synthesizing protein C
MAAEITRIGLLVRSGPYRGRSSRDQLDLALAAASLDFRLSLFFIGDGLLQLLERRDSGEAGLADALRGWRALPDFGSIDVMALDRDLAPLVAAGERLALKAKAVNGAEFAERLSACDRVLVD